jgi:hypothetical protein
LTVSFRRTDLLPDAVQVISGGELRVRGRAVWGEKAEGPFWIEPFLGCVRTSARRDAIVSYELRFADATYGLARFPYGKHLRWQRWFFPTQWLFVFSKGAVGDYRVTTSSGGSLREASASSARLGRTRGAITKRTQGTCPTHPCIRFSQKP